MPNHVKNRIEIKGTKEQVKEVINAFSTHYPAELRKAYDNKIICKQPNKEGFSVGWFDTTTGLFSRRDEADVLGLPEGWEMEIKESFIHFPDFNKVIPQPENVFNGDLGQKEEEMCKREGKITWLEFNRANWGTKWNSSSCENEDSNVFTFETAWNGVPLIVEAISKRFPDVGFIYEYADEDTGCNTGVYSLKNGITNENHFDNSSVEAFDLAFKLRPDNKEYYQLVDGEYEYIDED